MKVIKKGNTKKQCICEYCGTIVEYDAKEDIPASGIEWFKFECPLCNNTIRPNTKLDIQKVISSCASREIIVELNKLYNDILMYAKSKGFDGTELNVVDSILHILSSRTDELQNY